MRNFINKIAEYSPALILILIVTTVLVFLIFFLMGAVKDFGNRSSQWEEEKRFYKAISHNLDQVHLMVRAGDFYPMYISKNIEKILGLAKEDVKTDLFALFRVVTENDKRKIKAQLKSWEKEEPFETEFSFVNFKTGAKGTMHLFVEKETESDWENTIYEDDVYLVIIRDVTAEKEKEAELQEELAHARIENQAKTDFLSKMSHEIRTPMNGILGMLELAKMDLENPDVVEEYLEKAKNLSQFLLTLINDILDMSRIESGKTELECARFSIYDMADSLRAMFQKTIEEKGITFQLELLDFDIRYVMGDLLRLNQVIINFISNSIKFTEKGGIICITFRQMQRMGDQVRLMIRVRDTGKGIEPDFLSRIFKPFEQESTKVTKKYGGTGLGMAIADNIIRLMGGQIVIDSELGKGSDFTVFVSLPVAQGSQEAEVKEAETTGKKEASLQTKKEEEQALRECLLGVRILMAEDNDINAKIAKTILEKEGLLVERVVNGREAVDVFADSKAGYFDAILMDIQMPELNGWEATVKIRAMEREDAGTIPIYALSANAFLEDKRHSVEVGMNGHISKPIDFGELKRILAEELKKG